MRNLGTKELTSDRLKLRKFRLEDAKDMYDNYCNDEETCKYLTWKPHGNIEVTRGLLSKWISDYNDKNYRWSIECQGEVIGSIDLQSVDENLEKAMVGYVVGKDYLGAGIGTEALGLVINYAFNEVGFKRLESLHHIENKASGRVMMKNSMKCNGSIKNKYKDNEGKYIDVRKFFIENPNNIKIRSVEIEDASSYLEMLKQLDKQTKFMMFEEDERITTVEQQENIIKNSKAKENPMFLAEDDGEVVGFIAGQRGNCNRVKHVLYIALGIVAEYRGEGIGKRFMDKIDKWAIEKGVERIELTVICKNKRAKSLYESCGYEVEGVKRGAIKVDGELLDEYYMGKLI